MGRSQRHKIQEQGIASNGEIVSEGNIHPMVLAGLLEYAAQESKPVLTELQPATAAISDADFTIRCIGDNFNANSRIIWNGAEEPTTLVGPNEVTTLVKPSVVTSPTTVSVVIRAEIAGNSVDSEQLTFTWTDAVPPETVAGARGRE